MCHFRCAVQPVDHGVLDAEGICSCSQPFVIFGSQRVTIADERAQVGSEHCSGVPTRIDRRHRYLHSVSVRTEIAEGCAKICERCGAYVGAERVSEIHDEDPICGADELHGLPIGGHVGK